MRTRSLIDAAVLSLIDHKLRTTLSALGVVFGVMALIAMLAVGEGAKRETLDLIEQLGTDSLILRQPLQTDAQLARSREHLSRGLTMLDVERIAHGVPGVRTVAPLAEIPASIVDLGVDTAVEVVATTHEYFVAKGLEVAEGRPLCDLDARLSNEVCVLGAETARALGERGRVGTTLRIEDRMVEVVGVLGLRSWRAARDPAMTARNVNRTVFVPLSMRTALAGVPEGEGLSEISVRMTSSSLVASGADVLRDSMALWHGGLEDFQLVVPHELLARAFRTQQVFNVVLASIAAISLLVGGIGIMNIMLASVSERTREIGIRRAVGATQVDIVAQFLCEAVVLTVAGGAIGLAAGALAARAIAAFAGWSTVVTAWGVALSLAMALVVGLTAGLYPAVRASRLDPIVALRHL